MCKKRKKTDSKPVYNVKCLTTKITAYGCKIRADFYDKKIPIKGFCFVCYTKY